MDTFLIVGLMGIGAIMVGFVGFKFYTDTIIDEQEKEIAALRNENRRLQAALRGKRYVQNLVVSDIPADRTQAIVKPDFKKW